jgi:hypothetical protein
MAALHRQGTWEAAAQKSINQLELQGETRRPKARNTHFQGIQPVFFCFLLIFKKDTTPHSTTCTGGSTHFQQDVPTSNL